MKKLLTSIGAGMLAFLLMYLIGCFHSTTLNLSLWTSDCRTIISIFGTIFFIASFIITFVNYD